MNYAGKAGIEKYVENLTRLLPENGGEPYFAYNIAGPLSEKMMAAGIPTLRLSLEWKDARKAARTLANRCREQGIEVIHAQCPRENIIALMALRHNRKLRVVFTDHFTRRVGLGWRLLYRRFTPKNHAVIAVCQEGRQVLIDNGCAPEKIQVIYNGIEPNPNPQPDTGLRRELGLDEDTFLMCILARFEPEKGLDQLVRALAILKARTGKPFCCAVAGDGSLLEEVRSQVQAAGLEQEIRLLGYRTDTARILAGSQLYLCSSICNEALSFAILEAMNAGLPLVVTDVGGNRDLAETDGVCGLVVPPGDPAAFAEAIGTLMTDEPRRTSLGQEATKKIARRFDLSKLAKAVFATYQENGE